MYLSFLDTLDLKRVIPVGTTVRTDLVDLQFVVAHSGNRRDRAATHPVMTTRAVLPDFCAVILDLDEFSPVDFLPMMPTGLADNTEDLLVPVLVYEVPPDIGTLTNGTFFGFSH